MHHPCAFEYNSRVPGAAPPVLDIRAVIFASSASAAGLTFGNRASGPRTLHTSPTLLTLRRAPKSQILTIFVNLRQPHLRCSAFISMLVTQRFRGWAHVWQPGLRPSD